MSFRISTGPSNFRLTPSTGDELTAAQELVVQAIAAGTYFVFNETPTGAIDGANVTFTLASNPNPDASLDLRLGSVPLIQNLDYTLSTVTITMSEAPLAGSQLRANYTVAP